ncbi:MAG: choice-of-anchor D domain-containing protein [Ignavibacteriales bacterium]|nr:choice-of-anchor D domain-containing protein [Ignavibacteriales bacterium]
MIPFPRFLMVMICVFFALSGINAQPQFSVSPQSLSFGTLYAGNSKTDSLVVSNTGNFSLDVYAITSSKPNFAVAPSEDITIPAFQNLKITIAYSPVVRGTDTAFIRFTHNATGSPDSIMVCGTAIDPQISLSADTLEMGETYLWMSDFDSVVVSNPSLDTLKITTVTSNSPLFTVLPLNYTLPPQTQKVFYIDFVPQLPAGEKSAIITFYNNTFSGQVYLNVRGRVLNPVFTANTSILNFDTLPYRTSKTKSFTVTNTGGSLLILESVYVIHDDFSIATTGSDSLYPNDTKTFTITLTPTTTGADSTELIFFHNALTSADTVLLVGFTIDTLRYRSFDANLLALDKDNKGAAGRAVLPKPDRAKFTYEIVNILPQAAVLNIDFTLFLDTARYTKPFTFPPSQVSLRDTSKKITSKWTVIFDSPLDSGATVTITAWARKAGVAKIKKHSWRKASAEVAGKRITQPPKTNILGLPLPNRINVLTEVFLKKGFDSPEGLLVGVKRTDSSSHYGWALFRDKKQALITLGKSLDKIHNGSPRGFDRMDPGKKAPLVGEKNVILRRLQNNRLLTNMMALKLNIAASDLGITPVDFGELTYNDGTDNPLVNGKTIRKIASLADTMMMGYYALDVASGTRKHFFADSSVFKNLDSTIDNINNAFEGPIDTNSFSKTLRIKGTRGLAEIPYLRPATTTSTRRTSGEQNATHPPTFMLRQNFPNPFNPMTTIRFQISATSIVTLKIYNILGQDVATLLNKSELEEGEHEVEFDASILPSGVYYYRITAASIDDERTYIAVKKMVLMR